MKAFNLGALTAAVLFCTRRIVHRWRFIRLLRARKACRDQLRRVVFRAGREEERAAGSDVEGTSGLPLTRNLRTFPSVALDSERSEKAAQAAKKMKGR